MIEIKSTNDVTQIDQVVQSCRDAFAYPIPERDSYKELLKKFSENAEFIFAYDKEPLGYCAFYANDSQNYKAFISLIAVAEKYQNLHIGTILLEYSIEIMKQLKMKYCLLEVKKENEKALRFYMRNKFRILEERAEKYLLICDFNG